MVKANNLVKAKNHGFHIGVYNKKKGSNSSGK